MKPTCKDESMEMPPSLREEKDWEKHALRETTGLLSFWIWIKSKMYPKSVYGAGGVEVVVNVVNAFKSLSIKMSLPNKQIWNRRFTEVRDNFLPPNACNHVDVCCNESARGTSPVKGAWRRQDSIIFFVLSHNSLSLIGLRLRSNSLSLMGDLGLWVTSDMRGTGTSTGMAIATNSDELDASKEVGGRDPATKEIAKQPPTDCPPMLGVMWQCPQVWCNPPYCDVSWDPPWTEISKLVVRGTKLPELVEPPKANGMGGWVVMKLELYPSGSGRYISQVGGVW
jgi:hypothetical protein